MCFQLKQIFLKITFFSFLSFITTQCAFQASQGQKQLSGACASDIGVGENGFPWILGCGPPVGRGDFYIFSWNGSQWDMIPGVATQIAVEPSGTPWITNGGGQIYKGILIAAEQGSVKGWQQIPGCAKDIAVGNNSSAWIIGCESAGAGGFEIYSWNGSGWNNIPGAATQIAVEPNGNPWVVSADGKISKRSGNSWELLPGCAKDIAVGKNGSAWILGCKPAGAGGFELYSWNGSKWDLVPGSATGIAVEPNGTPWVINVEGKIFRL